jgi:hypothetical protein
VQHHSKAITSSRANNFICNSTIITEEQLDAHADYAESRGILPELILQLICESVQNLEDLRFPAQGSVGTRSYAIALLAYRLR